MYRIHKKQLHSLYYTTSLLFFRSTASAFTPPLPSTVITSSSIPTTIEAFKMTKRNIHNNMSKKKSKTSSSVLLQSSPATTIPSYVKGVFCGSGSDAMNNPIVTQHILELLPEDKQSSEPSDINVVYLGTATYDIHGFFVRQTQRLSELGCNVQPLNVAGLLDNEEDDQFTSDHERLVYYHSMIDTADIIVVGGGNTLFALDRWHKLGLDEAIKQAAKRGCILTGGSAGAICWFDGGHSNSGDPMTYHKYRIPKFKNCSPEQIVDEIYSYGASSSSDSESDSDDDMDGSSSSSEDESMMMMETSDSESDNDSSASSRRSQARKEQKKKNNKKSSSNSWEYFRVSALGILPGLVSPHLDKVQSNGVLRAYDFDKCLMKHPGEVGIGIDHYAALIVDGTKYKILSLPNKPGTVSQDGTHFVDDGSGKPGVWIKHVVNGKLQSMVCPSEGKLKDILHVATSIKEDEIEVAQCRKENQDHGWIPSSSLLDYRHPLKQ